MLEAAFTQPMRSDPSLLSDDDLARTARDDPAAFSALYQRYATRLYHYLFGQTGNAADAEDLIAQIFSDLIGALPRYSPRGSFAAWLFTIARRRLVDLRRRDPKWLAIDDLSAFSAPEADPLAQVMDRERIGRLKKELASLAADDLELLRLRFAAELDFREIARVLGRREPAVRMAMHRLLRRLEDRLEEPHE